MYALSAVVLGLQIMGHRSHCNSLLCYGFFSLSVTLASLCLNACIDVGALGLGTQELLGPLILFPFTSHGLASLLLNIWVFTQRSIRQNLGFSPHQVSSECLHAGYPRFCHLVMVPSLRALCGYLSGTHFC